MDNHYWVIRYQNGQASLYQSRFDLYSAMSYQASNLGHSIDLGDFFADMDKLFSPLTSKSTRMELNDKWFHFKPDEIETPLDLRVAILRIPQPQEQDEDE